MRVRISAEASILSRRAFSTFRIFPRSGRIACERRSRPCLAEPPAESPSTMKISENAGSFSWQSASLPGSAPESSAPLRRTSSRALRAASRARADSTIFSTIFRPTLGFSSRYEPSLSYTTCWTQVLTSEETSLSLVCEENFGSRDLDRHDRRETLAAVVARERRLLERLRQTVGLGVFLDGARQRSLEALDVGAAVAVVDRVGEGEERLGIALVPLDRDLDALLVGVALRVARSVPDVLEKDDLVVDRLLGLVQVLDERANPALVGEVVLLVGPLVVDRDLDAGIQERQLAQPLRQAVEMELGDREDLRIRPERDASFRSSWRSRRS